MSTEQGASCLHDSLSTIWSKMMPRPVTRGVSVTPGRQRLEDEDWFWGNVSKEQVSEAMSDTPDGTYLVRTGSKGREDEYTLTVRKGGHNKLLRIYVKDAKFGFTESCQFRSVVELVEHFQRHSLASISKFLDVVLLHPLSRHSQAGDEEGLTRWFISAHIDYLAKKDEYDKLDDQLAQISQDLQEKQVFISAFKETLAMLDEQIKTGSDNQKHVIKRDLPVARDNLALVKSRRALASQMETRLEKETGELTLRMRAVYSALSGAIRVRSAALSTREELKQKLLDAGESESRITLLVEGTNQWLNRGRQTSLTQLLADLELSALPHLLDTTWLDPICTRELAEQKLIGRPEGTFLIRPKSDGGRDVFVLSIMCHIESPNGPVSYVTVEGQKVARRGSVRVCHCQINRTSTGFGFAEPYFIHETLTDLVMHYRVTSLVEHNDRMDVMLKHPLYARSQTVSAATAAAAAAVMQRSNSSAALAAGGSAAATVMQRSISSSNAATAAAVGTAATMKQRSMSSNSSCSAQH